MLFRLPDYKWASEGGTKCPVGRLYYTALSGMSTVLDVSWTYTYIYLGTRLVQDTPKTIYRTVEGSIVNGRGDTLCVSIYIYKLMYYVFISLCIYCIFFTEDGSCIVTENVWVFSSFWLV